MRHQIRKSFHLAKRAAMTTVCALTALLILGVGTAYAGSHDTARRKGAAGAYGTEASLTSEDAAVMEAAKAAALSDAGVSSEKATFTKVKRDYEDGVLVYEIEFYTSDAEYEYEIRVSDYAVVDKSVEVHRTVSGTDGRGTAESYISVNEAKEIALQKAGLSSTDVTFKKAKLDRDDGMMVYEIEFYQGRAEYEVKVHATTGVIVDYEVDWD